MAKEAIEPKFRSWCARMARGGFCGGSHRVRRKEALQSREPAVSCYSHLVAPGSCDSTVNYLNGTMAVFNYNVAHIKCSYTKVPPCNGWYDRKKINKSLTLNLQKGFLLCSQIDKNPTCSPTTSTLTLFPPWREGWQSKRESWSALPTARQLPRLSPASVPVSPSHFIWCQYLQSIFLHLTGVYLHFWQSSYRLLNVWYIYIYIY